MSITKLPKKQPTAAAAADAFIAAAPDASAAAPEKPRRVRKGKKVQISLTIAEPLLEQVDDLAQRLSLSRAAVINLAISQGMEHGIKVDGARRDDV